MGKRHSATTKSRFAKIAAVLAVVVPVATAVYGAANLWLSFVQARALIDIDIGYQPNPPIPGKRVYVRLILRNIGHSVATIEGMAADRVLGFPHDPVYKPAEVPPVEIGHGDARRIISNLGTVPLILTQSELNSLKVIGFVKYSDPFSFFFRSTVIRYCYAWDTQDRGGAFGTCPDKNNSETYRYLIVDGLNIETVPMISISPQTLTSSNVARIPDPNYPIQKLETEP